VRAPWVERGAAAEPAEDAAALAFLSGFGCGVTYARTGTASIPARPLRRRRTKHCVSSAQQGADLALQSLVAPAGLVCAAAPARDVVVARRRRGGLCREPGRVLVEH